MSLSQKIGIRHSSNKSLILKILESMKFLVEKENSLLLFLKFKLNILSSTKVKNWIKYGGVKIDNELVKTPNYLLRTGQVVDFKKLRLIETNNPPFEIHYQDQDILIAEKPTGILSVGNERERVKTFLNLVNGYLCMPDKSTKYLKKQKVFIVHRLDRDVSGLMVFAKSQKIQKKLQDNWMRVTKKYFALVENIPPSDKGIIDSKLKENRIHKTYTDNKSPLSKRAITHYKIVQSFETHSILEVDIKTGRKNQIRAHLSELGCPIVGDKKYGSNDRRLRRLALHAFFLKLPHPRTGKEIKITSRVPPIFKRIKKHQKKY